MAWKKRVDELARVPLSFPTCDEILVRAANSLAQELKPGDQLAVEE